MLLFLLGFLAGYIFTKFPRIIKYRDVDKYLPEEFAKEYPDVEWVNRFLENVPLIWMVLYIFVILFITQNWYVPSSAYCIAFWAYGGMSLIDGIFEIISYISPERIVYMSRNPFGNRLLSLSMGENVRRYGIIRTALILFIGIVGPAIIQLTMN